MADQRRFRLDAPKVAATCQDHWLKFCDVNTRLGREIEHLKRVRNRLPPAYNTLLDATIEELVTARRLLDGEVLAFDKTIERFERPAVEPQGEDLMRGFVRSVNIMVKDEK